ncbi:glutamine-hydrolyzing carbamoyl-phosphate synthase small subunit [Gimesia fumaroli]|uniref:Carbamoyl phosphate synthase small chain n=1 Tax=Gimesia fumaroli TaxID=2527976 RepID=A0A518I8K1_9PLAN|nr:glutamine-hydrolyzing carbamoyl-phosphate synthase small subunit [Gimesia fumaroli]QDV49407.1 Carbamoyl-phosphate synthase small chain [Gimesia fumaroli]
MQKTAKLALADGSVFTGTAFGADGEVHGEVVFNTSMTGYQEILTDPSYCGQIVTMTYPQIGNYGIVPEDVESSGIALQGFIIRELCEIPSNYRATQTLDEYLKAAGVIGLQGIDTRALVRKIRTVGAMTGVLSTVDLDDESLVKKAQSSPQLVGQDLVSQVIPQSACEWEEGLSELAQSSSTHSFAGNTIDTLKENEGNTGCDYHIVAIDYGMKWNIARHLKQLGCKVTILPGNCTAQDVLDLNPDGVFLSNGPGDPEPLTYAIETIRGLLGKVPIFGICLGHQLLGLACGCKTFKLKFGHRGANQPVVNQDTGQVEITSQNHGFAIDPDSMPDEVEVTHINMNDNTVAGLRHKTYPAFSVQYHPEASAGPHDSHYLFQQFFESIKQAQVSS